MDRPDKSKSFEKGMVEIAQLLLRETAKPIFEGLFTPKEAHTAAQQINLKRFAAIKDDTGDLYADC